jgi:hypothetical protein
MSCIKHQMLDALRAKYDAAYKEAAATLRVYMESPVAIGEHPQHIEEMDTLICAMADASDKLEALEKAYPSDEEKEFLSEDGIDGEGGVIPHGESVTIQL